MVSKLRVGEWVLMLLIVYAFLFEAAPAAQKAVYESKVSDYRRAVDSCGLDPCRVPDRYRSALNTSVNCTGTRSVPPLDGSGNITLGDAGADG